jgi:hypothetical protein
MTAKAFAEAAITLNIEFNNLLREEIARRKEREDMANVKTIDVYILFLEILPSILGILAKKKVGKVSKKDILTAIKTAADNLLSTD